MVGERSLENKQNRTAWLRLGRAAGKSSLAFFEPSSPPCRHLCGAIPLPPSLAGRWRAYLFAVMVAICNADAQSLRMARGGFRGYSFCLGGDL